MQVDIVHRRLECDFPHHRVVDAARLDLQLAVVVPDGLRNERETQDRHPRVERQAGGAAEFARQLVLGINGGTGIHADRRQHNREHRGSRDSQQLGHPHILTHGRPGPSESG